MITHPRKRIYKGVVTVTNWRALGSSVLGDVLLSEAPLGCASTGPPHKLGAVAEETVHR